MASQPRLDELRAEPGEDRDRTAPAGDLEPPGEGAAREEEKTEHDELGRHLAERRSFERRRDDPREERRLREHERRHGDPDRHVRGEERARPASTAQEAAVERPAQVAVRSTPVTAISPSRHYPTRGGVVG